MVKKKSALEARTDAQKIAFAPVAFQVAKVMRDTGMLEALEKAGAKGLDPAEMAKAADVPLYGAETLLEAGLSFDLVTAEGGKYHITRTSEILLRDRLTRVNMNFVHDVCYEGLFYLDEAIRDEKPAGLKVFGKWKTIYEALASLPERVKKSWFDFDHYYSDSAFPTVLAQVFANRPKTLLDIGGNTGKWSLQCVTHDPDVEVTILDLPGQLAKARTNIEAQGYGDRIHGHPFDLLDKDAPFPKGFDAIWMSQFLCCFSKDEIVSILKRAAEAIDDDGRVYILDTYWDRQKFELSTYCLHATSIYFTALANGNSRMYSAVDMLKCAERAGLTVEREVDNLGLSHTLFVCRRAK